MEKKKWTFVNAENVVGYVDGVYTSKMLTGDEMAGLPVININEGTLEAGGKTGGGEHDDTEIYYIVDCDPDTYVWLDDDCLPTKPGDIIVIPPHVFHWIDNSKGTKPYKIFTFWPRQEQNGMFFIREKAWGTSVKNVDDDYCAKRMQKK